THTLSNCSGLGQGHIKVETSRTAEEVSASRAVAVAWIVNVINGRKCGGVKIKIAVFSGVHDCNLAEPGREIGIGQVAVASSRRSRVRCIKRQTPNDAERKSSTPAQDGVEAPSFHQALWSRCPRPIKRQIPSSTERDPLLNVEVG